jgi:hypothetical protein
VSVGGAYGPIPFISAQNYGFLFKLELSMRDKPFVDVIKSIAYYYTDKEQQVHTIYSSDLESNLILFDN